MRFSSAPDERSAHDRPPQRERRRARTGVVLTGSSADDESELAAYLNLLVDHWRLLALVCGTTVLVALLFALLLPPVFEASMLIYVEEATPSNSRNALNDVASMFDTKQAASAEMELLRSRAVLGPTVERLGLAIEARPDQPAVLTALAALQRVLGPGLFGTPAAIEVAQLELPAAWSGRPLRLTAQGGGTFAVLEPRSGVLAQGRVGQRLTVSTADGTLALKVAQLDGAAGSAFVLGRLSSMAAIAALRRDLKISEQGRQSGIIEVKFEAEAPATAYAVLREVGRQYLAQNLRHKSEEAEKSLAFLDAQLPKLKANLERAESDYNNFRRTHGSVDFVEDSKLSLMQAVAAQTRRSELEQRRTELLTRFTSRHPMVIAVTGQIADLDRQQASVAAHMKQLPLLEQEAGRLGRDIKINTDLYTALANTAQQLRIVAVGKVGNVRLVDVPMVDEDAVRPHRKTIVACGAVLGVLAGLAAVLLRKNFSGSVDDPLRIEALLGARVVSASIPHSTAQARLARRAARHGTAALLAREQSADGAVEALRSFRAALRFLLPQFKNNVIMFAGPTSGVGKSFISANFALVLAASGKRVLLIDADLRNGCVHQVFGVARGDGLFEAASGAVQSARTPVRQVCSNLDLLTTGSPSGARADPMLPVDIGALLESLRVHYDLVLVDSPPVLALADPLVIGSHAGAVFLVVRSGKSTAREIADAVKRLNGAGIAPAGIVFNDVKPRLSYYGYNYVQRYGGQLEFAQ
ncbi:GNVR domain-containing protein [Massilia sp. PWRC2]|uniref:GNVR domain-containing protein n=1 Tax=Massilia sp. PWRC2 TaxID=2804626 RepID=UPI003CF8859D